MSNDKRNSKSKYQSDYDGFLAFAVALSKRAGREMMRHYSPLGFPTTMKKDKSVVTVVDTLLNRMVIEAIHATYPQHDVLAEEESSLQNKGDFVWVCDPIDGTRQFSMGTANFSFSIGLTYRGISVLGVIYEPFTKKLYTAVAGKGAYLNGTKIHVNTKNRLSDSLCFFTASIRSRYNILGFVPLLIAHTKRVYNFACCTVEGNLVASGLAEGLVYANNSAHDFAALKVILEEAGGKITDLWGNDQRYDRPLKGVVLSNGRIHTQLIKLLKDTLAHNPYE